MDFDFTEEQRIVKETAAAFAEKEIEPVANQMDRDAAYPTELVCRLGELGFMGMFVPEELGGAGMDLVCYTIAMEEISKAWASLGVVMSVQNSLVCAPILRFGNAAQKKKYLASLARGHSLGCYSLTESGAGSDAGSIQTQARRVGNDYVLNGSKIFTTSGSRADLAIVYAVTDPAAGKKGISAFIVEKNTPWSRQSASWKTSSGCVHRIPPVCSSKIAGFLRRTCWGRGRRLQDRAGDTRWRPHRHRRPGARHRAGLSRRVAGLCHGAPTVRPADRRFSSDSVDACGYGDRNRCGSAVNLSRRLVGSAGQTNLHERGRHGQALCLGGGQSRGLQGESNFRRLRLYQRVRRRAFFPRCAHHDPIRRDFRDSAFGDRAATNSRGGDRR